jgi:hypothetical protein
MELAYKHIRRPALTAATGVNGGVTKSSSILSSNGSSPFGLLPSNLMVTPLARQYASMMASHVTQEDKDEEEEEEEEEEEMDEGEGEGESDNSPVSPIDEHSDSDSNYDLVINEDTLDESKTLTGESKQYSDTKSVGVKREDSRQDLKWDSKTESKMTSLQGSKSQSSEQQISETSSPVELEEGGGSNTSVNNTSTSTSVNTAAAVAPADFIPTVSRPAVNGKRERDETWKRFLTRYTANDPCHAQCPFLYKDHYHCNTPACRVLFRTKDGVRDHARCHQQQDQVTAMSYDTCEAGTKCRVDNCTHDNTKKHYHCRWVRLSNFNSYVLHQV